MKIVYRSGKTNLNADALSRSPQGLAPVEGPGQDEVQVSLVSSDIEALLQAEPATSPAADLDSFPQEQQEDPKLQEIIQFLITKKLQCDEDCARKHKTRKTVTVSLCLIDTVCECYKSCFFIGHNYCPYQLNQ